MIAQNGNHVPAVIESGAMKQGTKLPSMSFLIKPAFSLCNLRCKYCFYEDESENRCQKSYGLMSTDTMDQLLKSIADCTAEGGIVSLSPGGRSSLRAAITSGKSML